MKTLKNITIILVAILGATAIIKCQKAQRTSNIEAETLSAGQHKAVYYEYLAYIEGRE